jgi:hypothetical protein
MLKQGSREVKTLSGRPRFGGRQHRAEHCRPDGLAGGVMRRQLLFTFVLLLAPTLAQAQIHQVSSSASDGNSTIQFNIGYFALKGLDSRVSDDVLVGDLISAQPLLFEIKDFNGVHAGGEYLLGFGRIEAGVGLGYTQRTVPTVYANLTHSNGSVI